MSTRRGSGGYVVGPGSVIDGRRYRLTVDAPPLLLPGWLLNELLPRPPGLGGIAMFPRSSAYVDAVLRGEAARVEQAAVGTRNDTLFRAAARLGGFVAQGLVAEDVVVGVLEHACRRHADFGHREVERTIASGLRRAARDAPAAASPRRPGAALALAPVTKVVIHIRLSCPQTRSQRPPGCCWGGHRGGMVRIRVLSIGVLVLSCLAACGFDGPIAVQAPQCVNVHGEVASSGDEGGWP